MPYTIGVRIEGRGAAALTAALLLRQSGIACALSGPPPAPGPVLLLHPGTLSLLREVWGIAPADLPALHRIRLRAVKPLPPDEPALIEQPSLVIGSAALLQCLTGKLDAASPAASSSEQPGGDGWWLHASGRARFAAPDGPLCSMVEIVPSRQWLADRAVFEAVPGGWLFLLPIAADRALLQAQRDAPRGGDLVQTNLALSEVIPRLIENRSEPVQTFAAGASLAGLLTGADWIAIGDAAMALPPVSGDGVGNSIRTAIWAVACLRAIAKGEPREQVLTFYEWRLRQAFNSMAAHTGVTPAVEPTPDYQPPFRLDGLDLHRNS